MMMNPLWIETCKNTQCDIGIQISKEEHCAFSCLNVPNWLSILHGANNIENLFHCTHLSMADIAELQKWAWSTCLEGFQNNKTP